MKPIRTVAEVLAMSRYANAKRREPERRIDAFERRQLWKRPPWLGAWREARR